MLQLSVFETILYVKDQQRSADFYERILRGKPSLHVPGMTEFILAPNAKLGLMPSSGIVKLLEGKIEDPEKAQGIPRCELYWQVQDAEAEAANALAAGAQCLSPLQVRNWGDRVVYFADPDFHVFAFAEKA